MAATIEDRLTTLYDRVRGKVDVPWAVYRRLQFLARVLRGAPAGAGADVFLLWHDPRKGVASMAVARTDVVIGRDAGCDVVFSGRGVSRRHCVVRWTAGEVRALEVEDLGSSNGTGVNGVSLPAHGKKLLYDGDVIEIGGVALAVARIGAK